MEKSMKIISFCLFGQKEMYLRGAIKNAELAAQIYPGWIPRYYCGPSVPHVILNELNNLGAQVVICQNNDWTLMLTRYLPISEPDVEVTLVRDCDSRLSYREKEAVDEWLASDKLVCSLFDHPFHSGVKMMGGLSGFKRNAISNFSELLARQAIENRYQCDQDFLSETIYPLIKDSYMVFDGLNRDEFTKTVPFPSRRPVDGSFVGEVFDENNLPNWRHRHILALAESKIFKLQ